MSLLPSSSSSTSVGLASPSDRGADLMPLMGNLLSVMGGADAHLRMEVLKISQAISQFITQITEQLQTMVRRIVELEGAIVTSRAQTQEARRINEAQIKALQQFTLTMQSVNQRLNALESRISLVESSIKTVNMNLQSLTRRHNIHRHVCQGGGCLTTQYRE